MTNVGDDLGHNFGGFHMRKDDVDDFVGQVSGKVFVPMDEMIVAWRFTAWGGEVGRTTTNTRTMMSQIIADTSRFPRSRHPLTVETKGRYAVLQLGRGDWLRSEPR